LPRFRRTARAEDDLIEIWLNIAPDNERAANAVIERIDRVCESLAIFPKLGPARPDLVP
jgi:toxin ParE1/3/4